MTKPFSPRELIARVAAVLRRIRPALAGEQLAYDDIEMDVEAHRVRRDGKSIALGPTEFRLLKALARATRPRVLRERLLDRVWSHEFGHRCLEPSTSTSGCLRKALNDGGRRDLIRTVRSAGYSLDAEG